MAKADKLQKFVLFLPNNQAVAFRPGQTILEVAQANKLGLQSSCGGMGTCGACRVVVESGLSDLPERNYLEDEIAADRGFKANERLGCQIEACVGLTIRIPQK